MMLRSLSITISILFAVIIVDDSFAQDRSKRWYAMDYGPYQSATIQDRDGSSVTLKGRAIDLGGGSWVTFDTELLRMSDCITDGYLKLRGTAYDGAHGPIPSLVGQGLGSIRQMPGWAHKGQLDDPRDIPHGPLPRDWGRFEGLYLHGEEVVLAYQIAGTRVLEKYDAVEHEGQKGIVRTLEIAPHKGEFELVLSTFPSRENSKVAGGRIFSFEQPAPGYQRIRAVRMEQPNAESVIGGPSQKDYADAASGHDVSLTWLAGFGAPTRVSGQAADATGQAVPELIDGATGENRLVAFKQGNESRLVMDLGRSVTVTRIATWSQHKAAGSPQAYRVYGSDTTRGQDAKEPAKQGWSMIARVDTRKLGNGGRHGVRIQNRDSKPLGSYRYLLWRVEKHGRPGTHLSEIDVFAASDKIPSETPPVQKSQAVAVVAGKTHLALVASPDRLTAKIQPATATQRVKFLYWNGATSASGQLASLIAAAGPASNLADLCAGGPARWPQTLETVGRVAEDTDAYVVDTITVPQSNPWNSWLRFGAFDFVDANTAALSTWNGDVWLVSGLEGDLQKLTWKRFATGLHDPLGLKVVDGVIYTHGRDQITRLKDLNGDGEADLYETFNNDVLITKGFHEFAFDLQTDVDGNFYFSKGAPVRPGGRGFTKIVPHNGTVLKLSKDGKKLEVFATGLRAPNGIGVLPNGVVTSGENEGTWIPACRINYMRQGSFAGVKDTAHSLAVPAKYDDPLCFLPMSVDNSGGGQVHLSSDKWGLPTGQFLHQSYGNCSVYLVLTQEQDDRIQGGVVRIPVDFESSQMRGRFHPKDGQLYVCGFKGWQTRAAKDTAFQRVRYTGKPVRLPTGMKITPKGIYLTFSEKLDSETANDVESYTIEQWNYLYSVAYGSAEYSVRNPEVKVKKGTKNRDPVAIKSARLQADGRTVFLAIDGLQRVMQMHINFSVDDVNGGVLEGDIYNTVNFLGRYQKSAGN